MHACRSTLEDPTPSATHDNDSDPNPPPTQRPKLGLEALVRVTLRLASAIVRLDVSGELAPQRAAEGLRLSLRLVQTIASLPNHGDVSALDTLTTLAQLELTLVQLQRTLAPLHDARTRAAIRELEWRLAPLCGTYHAVRLRLSRLRHERAAAHGQ